MQKRAQVTIFVVLGIIIVSIIIMALYFRGSTLTQEAGAEVSERAELSADVNSIALKIDKCVSETLEDAVFDISRSGGYYPPIAGSYSYRHEVLGIDFSVPMYLLGDKEALPTDKDLADSFNSYMDRNLLKCVNGIEGISSATGPSAQVMFGDNIKAKVKLDVRVKDAKLSNFYGDANVDYPALMAKVKRFYNFVKMYNETINEIEVKYYAMGNGHEGMMEINDNNTLHFMVLDKYYNDRKMVFAFGVHKNVDEYYDKLIKMYNLGLSDGEPAALPEDGSLPEETEWADIGHDEDYQQERKDALEMLKN